MCCFSVFKNGGQRNGVTTLYNTVKPSRSYGNWNYTNSFHICEDDRLSLVSTYTAYGETWRIFLALLNGAGLYPVNIKRHGLAPLADWLLQQEITIYGSVATVFRQFASTLTEKEMFPKLRLIRLGGEPIYSKDVELYKKYFSPDCIFSATMGATEISPWRSTLPMGSVGRAYRNTKADGTM